MTFNSLELDSLVGRFMFASYSHHREMITHWVCFVFFRPERIPRTPCTTHSFWKTGDKIFVHTKYFFSSHHFKIQHMHSVSCRLFPGIFPIHVTRPSFNSVWECLRILNAHFSFPGCLIVLWSWKCGTPIWFIFFYRKNFLTSFTWLHI